MKKLVLSKLGVFTSVLTAAFCLILASGYCSTCRADVAPVSWGWWIGDEIYLDLFDIILIGVAVAIVVTVAVVLIAVLRKRKNKK